MHRAVITLAICLFVTTCKEGGRSAEELVEEPEFYISQSTDSEWPYRYTLIRTDGQWAGEIEIITEENSVFFDKMNVTSSNDQRIDFTATYGNIGKAFPMDWELTLSKSGDDLDGLLIAKGILGDFKPVHLKFIAAKSVVLPSSALEGKIRILDESSNRTEAALKYEVAMAKQRWEQESMIAERISKHRPDDTIRRGIRREWLGPAWVRDMVKPENSKYFERICCVYLGGTNVTDQDVQEICKLTKLRELYLHRTGISDAAFEHIGDLQALRVLHLRNTRISDEGLEKLRDLINLKELYLFETQISDAGGKKLQSTLPNTDIQW